MTMFKRTTRGFTLIELLVVIAIIGILSSVVLASLNDARTKSRDAKRIADIKQLQLALELSFDTNGTYPANLAALASGGQIASIPDDPLASQDYLYTQISATDYVLRAQLETDHSILDADVDGTVSGVACDDNTAPFYYCVQP